MKTRQKPIPQSYKSGGLEWHLLERIENWAIYGQRDSVEAVRANVRDFPPSSDSWGKDGFSFNGVGAVERARFEIRKQLNGNGRSKCKTSHVEDLATDENMDASGVPAMPSAVYA
jgi:hypothetical protein